MRTFDMSNTNLWADLSCRFFNADEFGHYRVVGFGVVAHTAIDLNRWLELHPDYDDAVWFNSGDGGDDVEVTDIFRPEADETEHRSYSMETAA